MTRAKSEARAESPTLPAKRGPARAENVAERPSGDAVDVFERLAQSANLLTVKELAALLAVSPKTVYGYVSRGLIPHYRIAASVRFRPRDIAEWLRSHAA
jgi:excisionase family DNA binding protein